MQQARDVCRSMHGEETEAKLYKQYGSDLDEYIYNACREHSGTCGLLCAKCQTKSAVVEMLQTRSADEGMTAFLVCQKCGHRRHYS